VKDVADVVGLADVAVLGVAARPTTYIGGNSIAWIEKLATPFGRSVMGPWEEIGPAVILRRCISGEFFATFDGTKTPDNEELLVISIGKSPGQVLAKYYFNPNKGFLLTKLEQWNETGKIQYVMTTKEVKKTDVGWYPARSVVVFPYNDTLLVEAFYVTYMDTNPDDPFAGFNLNLETGTTIATMGQSPPAQLKLRDDYPPVHIDELDDLLAFVREVGTWHDLKLSNSGSSTRLIVGLLAACMITFVVVWLMRKKKVM